MPRKADGEARSGRVPPWLPNALSVLRILLVPVWLVLAFDARHVALAGGTPSALGPTLVLVAIGLSDIVDGTLARRYHLATNLGATLDAVADKLAQVTIVAFLALFGAPAFVPLPLWLMLTLAARDLALGVGWLVVRHRRGSVDAEHRWHGKAATVLLFAVVVAALWGAPRPAVVAGSALVLALVVPSTLAYLVAGVRQLTVRRAEDRA